MFRNFLENLLSIILPKSRRILEIEGATENELVEKIPRAEITSNENFKALFQYKNELARLAIWEIKYKNNRKIAEKFSRLLYEFILEEISDEMAFFNFKNPLLLPVPAGKMSLRKRGFNQCELLAEEIIKLDQDKTFELSLDALKKIKETENQVRTKSRKERLGNLSDSFWVDSEKVHGRNVILVDDVITTGATLEEISKTLKRAGAKKVIGFSIAH